jgi:hypothetical protein
MVSGDDKYWFEKDETGKDVETHKQEEDDLFSSASAPETAPESVSKPAPSAENVDTLGDSADSLTEKTEQETQNTQNTQNTQEHDTFFEEEKEWGAKSGNAQLHSRHYTSDFAGRVTITPQDSTEKGKVGVRGAMLKKLLKYDFRALFKFLIPCYIVLLALAALCAICFVIANHLSANSDEAAFSSFFTSMMFIVLFYVLGVLACSFVCLFNIATRFQKNIFSNEGYLTLSIPATPEEHIFSKSISGFVTVVLTVFVAVLSIFIVILPYWSSVAPVLAQMFSDIAVIYKSNLAHSILFTIEALLLFFVSVIFNLQIIYSCLCVGHVFVNKNRSRASALAFVVYLAVVNVISTFSSSSGLSSLYLKSVASTHIFMWLSILFYSACSVGLFFWERYVLKNKVNLN